MSMLLTRAPIKVLLLMSTCEFNAPPSPPETRMNYLLAVVAGGNLFSLMSTTPLPSRVVATSNMGRKAGLGLMATIAFSSTVCT